MAIGITGTDVTREASDIVLTDDNFATIVKAVEQGRVIYDNIRKYARFLLACNFDELLVIGTFAILGGIFGEKLFPLRLLPTMILWINLVTDGGPAIALATDPPDVDVMDRPPRKPEREFFMECCHSSSFHSYYRRQGQFSCSVSSITSGRPIHGCFPTEK